MINRLLGALSPTSTDEEVPFDELSPEEQAEVLAEEKKARIDWHARNVRTGPARFTTVTPGRQASKARRSQRAAERKMNVKHRRRWIKSQQAHAVLRGQLQAVGALPYATEGFAAPLTQRIKAGQWLVGAFGERDDEGHLILHDDLLRDSVQAALTAYHGKNTKQALRKDATGARS